MADTDYSTLEKIRLKVRRLTRSPSTDILSVASLDEYINSFVLYDFPSHLKLNSLRKTFTFFTEAYVGEYPASVISDDFINKYVAVYTPIYVDGVMQVFSQSREQFYNDWPQTISKKSEAKGNAVLTNFTGTLDAIPVLKGSVSFSSVTDAGISVNIYDVPTVPHDNTGVFAGDIAVAGSINYLTGVYDITFDTAPGTNIDVYSNTFPYKASRPSSVLYFDNTLTFRHVPDQAYKVSIEVAQRPTELTDGEMPELAQWSDYIAYGAAKKVFEDRMDMESVQAIMPEFKKQETLVNRRTIAQQSSQRTGTLYSEMSQRFTKIFNIGN